MNIAPRQARHWAGCATQAQITGCAIIEQADGSVTHELREFGGFKRDRKALAEWALRIGLDFVVMKRTSIQRKSPDTAPDELGVLAWGVNARHVKAVPGRETDAPWLASLPRAGLLRAPLAAGSLHRPAGCSRCALKDKVQVLNVRKGSEAIHRGVGVRDAAHDPRSC